MCTRRVQITQLCFWLIDGRSEIFWAFVSLLNPTLKTIKTPPPAVKYGDEIWKLSYTERNNNALLLSLLINSCCSTSQIVILLKYLCGKDVQFTTDEYYWKRIWSSYTFAFINTLGPVWKKRLLSLALVRKLDHLFLKVMIKNIKVAAEVLLN